MKIIMTLFCTTVLFCSCKNVTGTESVALPSKVETTMEKVTPKTSINSKASNADNIIKPEVEVGDKNALHGSELKMDETSATSEVQVKEEVNQPVDKVTETKNQKATEVKSVTSPKNEKQVNLEKELPVTQSSDRPSVDKTATQKTKVAQIEQTELPKTKPLSEHAAFDALLKKYVTAAGKVNYKGVKADVDLLNTYLAELSATDISALNKKEQLAFYINAYNAFTIKKIVDNYPVKSITDLDGGKPWDVQWISLNNQKVSLNNIENDIIRPTFNEPRIHFAVNCAAKSCPPLLNKAWTADNLEANFEKQAKAFINNPTYNQLDSAAPKLSKIFEWYAVDFDDLVAFVNKYANNKVAADAKLGYKEYDWTLNE